MRLGSGDYQDVDKSISRTAGQVFFLEALDMCVPKVRRDLVEDEPRQIFKEMLHKGSMPSLIWSDLASDPRSEPLRQAIEKWADNYHLKDEWCKQEALLALWGGGEWRRWRAIKEFTTEEERMFFFMHLGGDLAYLTRAEIKKLITRYFEKQLDSYLDRLEALTLERGGQPTPEKYDVTHFNILVRRQVEWRSYIDLQIKFGYSIAMLRQIVSKTSRLIGLTLIQPPKN
jgi:hypothetical protein